MSPGDDRGAPREEGAAEQVHQTNTSISAVNDKVWHPTGLRFEFLDGFSLGSALSYEKGHADGVAEEAAGWQWALGMARGVWREPRHEEVVKAREVNL